VRLPGGEHVRIEERKVRSYLLSTAHPVGRFKARVFASAGFTESAIDAFVSEIRRVAAVGEVSRAEDTEFGRKYTIPGTLTGPVKAVHVLTVWIEEPGQRTVRLVTVQPR
jgi:Domain of unknown function (DUF6883)